MERINLMEIYPYGVPRSYINHDGELIVEMEAYINGVDDPVMIRINLGDDKESWEELAHVIEKNRG